MTPTLEGSATAIQSAIEQYFAASCAENQKVEAMIACFAEDSVSYDPADGPALEGHEGLRQFFNSVVSLFKEVSLNADNIYINGHEAAVKWSGRGISHHGMEVHFDGIDWFEFNAQGQIQSMKAYWNPTAMLSQLQWEEATESSSRT
jgi:steroid Delta-isomerase